MTKLKKVGIIGAGGFTGQEIIRILQWHTGVELVYISSSANKGKVVSEVFPGLEIEKYQDICFSPHPVALSDIPDLDVIFLATEDSISMRWVPDLIGKIFCIDLSGCFRLPSDIYELFHGTSHKYAHLLSKVHYGLTEMNNRSLESVEVIANPGCYPTSILLPLIPLEPYKKYLDDLLIVDSKSGVSGAGARKERDFLTFSGVYDNFKAYKLQKHQHHPEILCYARKILKIPNLRLRFTPHLLPAFRGILTQIYIPISSGVEDKIIDEIHTSYENFAKKEPFFRFYPNANEVELAHVQRTNFIDVAVTYDTEAKVLQITSCIDNLMKGAAGQAIQNMNLKLGFPERLSLYE